MNEPYERLAQAVVVQAAHDYRDARRKLAKNPNNLKAQKEAVECEKFFRSQWFYELSGINGRTVLKRLQEEFK